MNTQEALFEMPVSASSNIPPSDIKPVALAEPLGPCVKCEGPATVASPGGSIYCKKCGKCGGKTVEQTALGIEVNICGRSVEKFVMHPRLGIWCCPCILQFEEDMGL
jgi:hypothetical protein